MTEKTINDVHSLVLETQGDVKVLVSKYESFEKWREQHEKDDKVEHAALHKRVSDMKIFSTTASVISLIVGIVTGTKVK